MAPAACSSFFQEARLPEQRLVEGVAFPAVLVPAGGPPGPAEGGLDEFLAAVRSERASRVEPLLREAGAVLLRGSPARTAADFDAAVEAFGYEELPYVGGAAPRTNVVGRVFTANESPPDQKIPFHHEMAQVPTFPAKLFFCEVEPKSGGETPIVLSHYVYKRMKENFPEFVEKLEKHGLIYTRVLGEGDDPSSPIGRGWQSTFLTKDKSVAEESFTCIASTATCGASDRLDHTESDQRLQRQRRITPWQWRQQLEEASSQRIWLLNFFEKEDAFGLLLHAQQQSHNSCIWPIS